MSTACRMAISGDPTKKAKRSILLSSTMFLPTSLPTTSRRGSPTGSSHLLSGYSPQCGFDRTPPSSNSLLSGPPAAVVYTQGNILPSIIIYFDLTYHTAQSLRAYPRENGVRFNSSRAEGRRTFVSRELLCTIIAGMNSASHLRNLLHQKQIVQHYPPSDPEDLLPLPTIACTSPRHFY